MDRGKRILKWIRSKIILVKRYATSQQKKSSFQNNSDVHCIEEKSMPAPSICSSDQSESSQTFSAGKLYSEVPAVVQQSRSSHQPLLSSLDRILPGINNVNHVHQNTGELKKEFPQEEEQVEYSHKNKPNTTLDGCARYPNLNLAPISEEYKNSQKLPELTIAVSNGRKNLAFEFMGNGLRSAPFHNRKMNSNQQLTSKLQQKMKKNHQKSLNASSSENMKVL